MKKLIHMLIAGGLVVASLASTAGAQAVMSWMDPRLIKTRPVVDYRVDKDEQLFYAEQRIYGGIEWDIVEKHCKLVAAGGYGFDRQMFESESFLCDSRRNRIQIADGAFAYLRLRLKF